MEHAVPASRRNRRQNEGREVRVHGTTTGYRYGCRCAECHEAKRRANARRVWTPRPKKMRRPSKWCDATGKRIWTAADKEREAAKHADPAWVARRNARRAETRRLRDQARRLIAERNSAERDRLIADARAHATDELAVLIDAQAADARAWVVWSVSLDAVEQDRRGSTRVEWSDPTADAVLERLAA